MKPRFLSKLAWADLSPEDPDGWMLRKPLGLAYKDLVIIAKAYHFTDGASIPTLLRPFLGEPFENENKFWAVPHDAGYGGWAGILRAYDRPELVFRDYCCGRVLTDAVVDPRQFSRHWWDNMCCQGAMVAAGEPSWKRHAVHAGLTIGGGGAWKKHH